MGKICPRKRDNIRRKTAEGGGNTVKFQRISPKGLAVWLIRLTLGAFAVSFLISLVFPERGLLYWILTGLWLFAYFVLFFLYYPIRYYRLSYAANLQIVVLNCGVIYRRRKAIFLRNIQYTTTTCTPIQAIFGLCTLVIHAPGGFILIPHLTRVQCERLRDWLEVEDAQP